MASTPLRMALALRLFIPSPGFVHPADILSENAPLLLLSGAEGIDPGLQPASVLHLGDDQRLPLGPIALQAAPGLGFVPRAGLPGGAGQAVEEAPEPATEAIGARDAFLFPAFRLLLLEPFALRPVLGDQLLPLLGDGPHLIRVAILDLLDETLELIRHPSLHLGASGGEVWKIGRISEVFFEHLDPHPGHAGEGIDLSVSIECDHRPAIASGELMAALFEGIGKRRRTVRAFPGLPEELLDLPRIDALPLRLLPFREREDGSSGPKRSGQAARASSTPSTCISSTRRAAISAQAALRSASRSLSRGSAPIRAATARSDRLSDSLLSTSLAKTRAQAVRSRSGPRFRLR